MRLRISILLMFLLVLSLEGRADSIMVRVEVVQGQVADAEYYAYPMSMQDATPMRMQKVGTCFEKNIPKSVDGLYYLLIANQQMQCSVPFYADSTRQMVLLPVVFNDNCPQIRLKDGENLSLSAYNLVVWNTQRKAWMEATTMCDSDRKALLDGFKISLDSVMLAYNPHKVVAEYLRLWADISAFGAYSIFQTSSREKSSKWATQPFSQLYPIDVRSIDTDKIFNFPTYLHFLLGQLPKQHTLIAQLFAVNHTYNNERIRQHLYDYVIDNFLNTHNYEYYQEGLEQLKRAVNEFHLSENILQEYAKRKSSVPGQAFPAEAKLTDMTGKTVTLESLRNYYVYIDLWASWCGPCCREIPYLQQLEKDLQNPLVKFVSISLDTKEASWKNKAKQLQLHGYQWLNRDNSLAKALNVTGIPFFVIYDKEGKLLKYDAPRPSDPALKTYLESLR